MKEFQTAINGTLTRLRFHTPFFATLSLFVKILESSKPETDGFHLYLEPNGFLALEKPYRDAAVLHLLLHAAFNHNTRRKGREKQRWNLAADIVVNGIIASYQVFKLPEDAPRKPEIEQHSVEEIYTLLQQEPNPPQSQADLLEPPPPSAASEPQGSGSEDNDQPGAGSGDQPDQGNGQPKNLEQYWKGAVGNAAVIAKQAKTQGNMPAGLLREFGLLTEPQIPWRDALARLVSRRPVDFTGYDRRFFSRGLYLDALEGISVTVDICIDTSGSIGDEDMRTMMSEIQGILNSYPNVKARISYADAKVYGPYPFESWETLERPKGGGGTDFRPFFGMLTNDEDGFDSFGERIAIYLTDGYGDFPSEAPDSETIWVVIAGGLEDDHFPFGTVLRMFD